MPTVSLLFCDGCGSERVDVVGSKGTRQREYRVRCFECGAESAVKGFTLGRAEATEPTLREARGGRSGQDTMRLTPWRRALVLPRCWKSSPPRRPSRLLQIAGKPGNGNQLGQGRTEADPKA